MTQNHKIRIEIFTFHPLGQVRKKKKKTSESIQNRVRTKPSTEKRERIHKATLLHKSELLFEKFPQPEKTWFKWTLDRHPIMSPYHPM